MLNSHSSLQAPSWSFAAEICVLCSIPLVGICVLEFLVKFYGSCCDLADTLVILHYYTADYKKSIQVPMDTYIHAYKFIWRQNCENESEALAQDD